MPQIEVSFFKFPLLSHIHVFLYAVSIVFICYYPPNFFFQLCFLAFAVFNYVVNAVTWCCNYSSLLFLSYSSSSLTDASTHSSMVASLPFLDTLGLSMSYIKCKALWLKSTFLSFRPFFFSTLRILTILPLRNLQVLFLYYLSIQYFWYDLSISVCYFKIVVPFFLIWFLICPCNFAINLQVELFFSLFWNVSFSMYFLPLSQYFLCLTSFTNIIWFISSSCVVRLGDDYLLRIFHFNGFLCFFYYFAPL